MAPSLACGRKRQPPGYCFATSAYDQYQAIVVLGGRLMVDVRNSVIALGRGGLAVLPVGAAFRLSCDGESGYHGVFVILPGPVEAAFRGEAIALPEAPDVLSPALLLDAEVRRPGTRSAAVLAHLGGLLAELAARRLGSAATHQADDPEHWVRLAEQAIASTIYTGEPVARCLAGIPLGYRQLSRHFRALRGMTPKAYQRDCRMAEARRLLATTHLAITDIALELGFASSQHFAGQFSRHVGLTPSAYRRAGRG